MISDFKLYSFSKGGNPIADACRNETTKFCTNLKNDNPQCEIRY